MGMKKMREKGERMNFKREIGELRKELKTREATAITQILKSADVVLSTNTGLSWVKKMIFSCNSLLMKGNQKALVCVCRCLSWWTFEVPASRALWLGGDRRVRSGPGEQLLDRPAQSAKVHSGWRLQAVTTYYQITKVKNRFFCIFVFDHKLIIWSYLWHWFISSLNPLSISL